MARFLLPLALLTGAALVVRAADDEPTFKSDVALSRVDAQVMDRDGRSVTGLTVRDFILRVDGKVQPIKGFDSESMPIDILLLLDVSGSMRPHVERMAEAAKQALDVLAEHDRLAIMIFDTYARERLAFTSDRRAVTSELNRLVRSEGFNGGTHITGSMISAAQYVQRHARDDARRAIVILTDDETQDSENEPRVEAALSKAHAILSFLQAPYEVDSMRGPAPPIGRSGGGIGLPGGGWPGTGGGWPGSGGGGVPGGGGIPMPGDPDHTAGTDTIARDSGGDVMPINDASSLAETLSRLRQRYALHFYMPADLANKAEHSIRVDLAANARILHPEAEVRAKRVFLGGNSQADGPTVISHQKAITDPIPGEGDTSLPSSSTAKRKRAPVNEDSGGPAGASVGPPDNFMAGSPRP